MAAESKKNRHERAHFSLGNDENVKVSSYQTDFSVCRLQTYTQRGKPTPPRPAEIVPHVDETSEKHKWVSSTMRDFTTFGDHARKRAYETSKSGFMETKHLHNKDVGLLRDNFTPVTSSYDEDYRQPGICTPTIPEYIRLTKSALKRIVDKREENISEARHAFQWPSADRLKAPLHLQKTGPRAHT